MNELKVNLKILSIIVMIMILPNPEDVSARSINLDEIYIKKTSKIFKKLNAEKLDVYQKLSGSLIDGNVIFAFWTSGNEIVYIKESNSAKINFIIKHRITEHKSSELCRIHGVITVARISSGSRYLILKRLVQGIGAIPYGEMIFIDIKSGKTECRKSSYAFLDFSFSQDNDSILFEQEKGIYELFLDTGFQSEFLQKTRYNDIIVSTNPAVAYLSNDRQKIMVLNGSGGNYRAKILFKGDTYKINGVTSSSEIYWLDNFSIVYRTGHAGNYSVILYDIKNKKALTLLEKSFNTNICYSPHAEILSFLKEQIIHLYKKSENKIINTGVEGEDIYFAPDGNRFISLLFKRLFLLNNAIIEKKSIELKRSWKSILSIYNDLYKNKDVYENEYSELYIYRKIQLYKGLADI